MSGAPEEDTNKIEVVYDKVAREVESDCNDQDKQKELSTTRPDYTAKHMTSPEDAIKQLKDIYDCVEEMVTCEDYDSDLQDVLSKDYPNYTEYLKSAKRDLLKNDCGIVVTGETSGGKSTLVRILIGKKKLLKSSIRAATGAITRIRNSEDLCVMAYSKDEQVLMKEDGFTNEKDLKKAIEKLTDMKKMPNELKQKIYYVDVNLPVPMLKGNVILVDTPGVGETEEMNTMLLDFLQHAVAFVFIVNARNAGGITTNRLGRILESIIKNRDNMPCFDMKDALFLTNQWDLVECDAGPASDSDDTDDESEIITLWKDIKMKITDIWRGLPPENIFQISLKQIEKDKKTKYTDDYSRFECHLKETIAKNQNKRVQFYFRFIQKFQWKAGTFTLARLEVLEKSEDELKACIKKTEEQIHEVEEEKKEWKRQMVEQKKGLVEELSHELNDYIRSDCGKDEILNPPGERDIGRYTLVTVKSEVKRRLQNGVSRWCEKGEVQARLMKADDVINKVVSHIGSRLSKIEQVMLGVHPCVGAVEMGMYLIDISLIGLLLFPAAFVFGLAFAVILAPVYFVASWFVSEDQVRDAAGSEYERITSQITIEHLRKGFEDSIGKEFDKVIHKIFNDVLPKEIRRFRTIIRKQKEDVNNVKAKEESIMRMKCRIKNIGEKIEEFRKTWG